MRLLAVLLVLPVLLPAGGDRRATFRAPALEVVELTAHRTNERTVEIDGRVRNISQRKLKQIVLKFKVLAPGDEVLTTQRGPLESPELEPDDTAEFHWQMRQPARAVSVLVTATSRDIEIDVAKPGPYMID